MTEDQKLELIRENERMKTALHLILDFAGHSMLGAWRGRIYKMAKRGLGK